MFGPTLIKWFAFYYSNTILYTIYRIVFGVTGYLVEIQHNFFNSHCFSFFHTSAATSSKWANEKLKDEFGCSRLAHSPGNSEYRPSSTGENIYMRLGIIAFTDFEMGNEGSTAWYNEISDYKWPGDGEAYVSCPSVKFSEVGHFTQVSLQWKGCSSVHTKIVVALQNCKKKLLGYWLHWKPSPR